MSNLMIKVKNRTGKIQVMSPSGLRLDPNVWVDVPLNTATELFKRRLVDIELPENVEDFLWETENGSRYLYWMSPFSLGDGYGTAAETMVHALIRQGVELFAAQCWFVSTKGLLKETIKLLRQGAPGLMRVGLCMATPGEFIKLPVPYKIGLTMYEADEPLVTHPEWQHDCECIDRLIVPSEYCKEIFSTFVKAPIDVAPLAVSPRYHTQRLRRPKDTFTFVTWGTLNGRKAPLETLEAFKKAFPVDKYPDARIEFKTRFNYFGWGENQLPNITDRRIKILNGTWFQDKMVDWLHKADAMLFLSKGEGFGMPPREALCTGLPTIFTNHTGMVSMADDRYNWPVPVGSIEESPLGGDWRLADWDYAIDVMRWMYNNREAAFQKAHEGSQWFVREHGADAVGKVFADLLLKIDPSMKVARATREPEETLDNLDPTVHERFVKKIMQSVEPPGPILDVGVGEGLLYSILTRAGYDVYGVTAPGRLEAVAKKLKSHGVESNLVQYDLMALYPEAITSFGWRQPKACVSLGALQVYAPHELALILKGMLRVSKVVHISVPSVKYPSYYSEGSNLWRAEHWERVLLNFIFTIREYDKGRYLMLHIRNFDSGRHVTASRRGLGRFIQGIWHPSPVRSKVTR